MIDLSLLDPAIVREDSVEKMHRAYDHPANRLVAWIGTAAARRLTSAERDDALEALHEYRVMLREGRA